MVKQNLYYTRQEQVNSTGYCYLDSTRKCHHQILNGCLPASTTLHQLIGSALNSACPIDSSDFTMSVYGRPSWPYWLLGMPRGELIFQEIYLNFICSVNDKICSFSFVTSADSHSSVVAHRVYQWHVLQISFIPYYMEGLLLVFFKWQFLLCLYVGNQRMNFNRG